MLPSLILANEFADILTTGAVAAPADLLVNKTLEGVRQRNVYCAHGKSACGKICQILHPSRSLASVEKVSKTLNKIAPN
jgi:hypothetical protein